MSKIWQAIKDIFICKHKTFRVIDNSSPIQMLQCNRCGKTGQYDNETHKISW